MSSLLTRMGWIKSNLKNAKEFVMKHGKTVVGFGIVALASTTLAVLQNTQTDGFTPAVIHVKNIKLNVFSKTIDNSGDDKGSKENLKEQTGEPKKITEKDHAGQETVILLNLEQFVKQTARKLYKQQHGSYFKRDDTVSVVDWSDVKLFPELLRVKRTSGNRRYGRYDWDQSETIEDVHDYFRVISRTVLTNESSKDQQHKLKFEKKIVSVFCSSLIQGYTNGPSIELLINKYYTDDTYLPDKIMLPNGKGTTEEDTCTLLVEDHITVPSKSISVVSILVSKQERNYSFWTQIVFKGNVNVKFYNKKEELIACYFIPMENIISSLPDHYNIGVIEGRLKLTYKINKIHEHKTTLKNYLQQ